MHLVHYPPVSPGHFGSGIQDQRSPPGRNSNSLGGKALMSEEEPERGILMSLPHPRIKHIKQMNFRATIVNKERHLGGTKKDFLPNKIIPSKHNGCIYLRKSSKV